MIRKLLGVTYHSQVVKWLKRDHFRVALSAHRKNYDLGKWHISPPYHLVQKTCSFDCIYVFNQCSAINELILKFDLTTKIFDSRKRLTAFMKKCMFYGADATPLTIDWGCHEKWTIFQGCSKTSIRRSEPRQRVTITFHSTARNDWRCAVFTFLWGDVYFLKMYCFFVGGGEMKREEHRDRCRDADKKNRNMMFPFSP